MQHENLQSNTSTETVKTSCCVAGGGPAGMMLGFLLARAGVDVLVLEKHADFLRDFRGDTIHPSTLELMYELGLLEEFLKRPHQQIKELRGQVGQDSFTLADFSHLPTQCKFIAFMPQWDFLNFLADQGRRYSGFHLETKAEATDLIEENGHVVGVRVTTPQGQREVRANLTIGADGRHSVIRQRAGLPAVNLGAPMDVMWMRLSRRANDPGQTFGYVDRGRLMVLLNREDYWQCAFVIPKGAADEIRDWKDISLLTVVVDRLTQWSRPGLLCIGDAAHAMSPIGGVGINLAIQDAVAAANILGPVLMQGTPTQHDLDAVQQRRMFPTRATQRLQLIVQNNIIRRVLASTKPLTLPWFFKLFERFPYLRRIPARLVGIGFRPEHIQLPAKNPKR